MRSIAVAIYAAGIAVAYAYLAVAQSEMIASADDDRAYYMLWLGKQYMFGGWALSTLILIVLLFVERDRPSKGLGRAGDAE